jgi:hypothetical protein
VYVDNPGGIRIGYFEAHSCLQKAFRALGGVSNVVISGGRFVNNNQNNTAGLDGAPLDINSAFAVLENLIFVDTQSPATQTSGIYLANGVKAFVNGCRFGAGIVDTQQIWTASLGTCVRFGRGNVGLVTYARGTYTANGGSTTHTETFPTAITAIPSAQLSAQVTPASADASGGHWINSVSATQIRVDYASATPAGTNNVSYRYDVEMEIVR